MKKIIVFSYLLLLWQCIYAQDNIKISGVIKDALSNDLIPYVTVAAYENDTLLNGVLSDENGKFEISIPDNFKKIEFSIIAYSTLTVEKNEIPKMKDWEVHLQQDNIELNEVVVRGQQSVTKLLVDRKVINLGADIQQSGKDMLGAMEQIPDINVDRASGNISLRGSSTVKILINGKSSGLSTKELLEQIPANTVNKIELITSPSAKHRADGMSGLINIITKKDTQKGLNLNASLSGQTPNPKSYRAGISGNYNYRFVNVRFGGNRSYSDNDNNNSTLLNRIYNNNTKETIKSLNDFSGGINNFNLGTDFFINEKNELSVSLNYTDNSHDITTKTTFTDLTNRPDYSEVFNSYHSHKTAEANTNYRHIFSKDHFIEFDYNANINNNNLPSGTISPSGNLDEDVIFNNLLHQVSIDYALPIKQHSKFEAGFLYNNNSLENNYTTYFDSLSGENKQFDYYEKIGSAYALYHLKIKKWTLQGGLRYEYFDSKATSDIETYKGKATFSDLFPSTHLAYALSDAHQFNFGYSKRISRPNFWHIKPYTTTPTFYGFEGNPNLKPEYGHNFEINYQFHHNKFRFSTTAFYRKKTDIIEQIFSIDENTEIRSFDNLGKSKAYGLEANLSISPFNFWTFISDANYYWSNIETSRYTRFSASNSFRYKLKNTINIGKKFTTDLNFRYNGTYKGFYRTSEPYSWLDWSIRYHSLNNKLNITFSIYDVFNDSAITKYSTFAENYVQTSRFRYGKKYSRSFAISLSYKILQAVTKKRNRKQRSYSKQGTTH